DHIVARHGAEDVAVGVAYHQHGVGQRCAVAAEYRLLSGAQHLALGIDDLTVLDRAQHLAVGIDQLAVDYPAKNLAAGVAGDFAGLADDVALGVDQLAVDQAGVGFCAALHLRTAHVDHPAAGVEGGVLGHGAQRLAVQAGGLAVGVAADHVAAGVDHLAVDHPTDDVTLGVAHHGGTLAH